MSTSEIKMSYIPAQFRVRVELSKASCMASPQPPADLFERAEKKMESEVAKGVLAFYRVYSERFSKIWELMRESQDPLTTTVNITIAAGAPELPRIIVEKAPDDKCLALLTIKANSKELEALRYRVFKLSIGKKLKDIEIDEIADPSHLKMVIIRARRGELVVRYPIYRLPSIEGVIDEKKNYGILINKKHKDISLVVNNLRAVASTETIKLMLKDVVAEISKISHATGERYEVLKNNIVDNIKDAIAGPERYGIDMPMVILAAVNKPTPKASFIGLKNSKVQGAKPGVPIRGALNRQPANGAKKDGEPSGKKRPLPDLEIERSEDNMQITISRYGASIYETHADATVDYWRKYFKSNGVAYGLHSSLMDLLCVKIANRENLKATRVAEGLWPSVGKGPYIFKSYQHVNISEMQEISNLRDLQQRRVVKAGQLVAEIKYKLEPIVGMDVMGNKLEPQNQEILEVTAGEGIQIRDETKFYATYDGAPKIENNLISIEKALIYKGNVNLTSGNIDFDGPVEIMGAVERGARVTASGDIIVHGLIEGGFVSAGGSITVKGGIILRGDSVVRARGDISADFIENAVINAGGSVYVNKSIVACRIFATHSVEVKSADGLIVSSEINCFSHVICGNLGRQAGTKTTVNVGSTVRWERALATRKNRLERIKEKQKEDRASFRTLSYKTGAQMTARHQDMKDKLAANISKGKRIMDKLAMQIVDAKAKIQYNSEAYLTIRNIMARNCEITAGGTRIAIDNEVAGVAIVAKRIQGEHIISLERFEEIRPAS